jgi:sec-independent protein translocase protein TatA
MPLHWYDLAVLVGLALLIFGPKRLPEMGSAIGKTIKEFQRSMREVTEPPANTTASVTPPAAPQQLAQPGTTAATPLPAQGTDVSATPASAAPTQD